MTSRLIVLAAFAIGGTTLVHADAFQEVNAWRRAAGLPQLIEDPAMTAFAKRKARFRAARGLKNGHQGPSAPAGWTEGCGEATPSWGWLTCATECDFRYGGAGVAVGADGERYMVFVGRGGSGRALINPSRYPLVDTSHLTPNPGSSAGRPSSVGASRVQSGKVQSPRVRSKGAAPTGIESSNAQPLRSPATVPTARVRCPNCGQIH